MRRCARSRALPHQPLLLAARSGVQGAGTDTTLPLFSANQKRNQHLPTTSPTPSLLRPPCSLLPPSTSPTLSLLPAPAPADKLRKLAQDGYKRFEGFEYDVEGDIKAYQEMAATVAPFISDTVYQINEW